MARDSNVCVQDFPTSHVGLFRKLDIRVLGFLSLCYAFAYVDHINGVASEFGKIVR